MATQDYVWNWYFEVKTVVYHSSGARTQLFGRLKAEDQCAVPVMLGFDEEVGCGEKGCNVHVVTACLVSGVSFRLTNIVGMLTCMTGFSIPSKFFIRFVLA